MNRTQNLRWKRKAAVAGLVAVSFAGYAALGSSTVSAGNYGAWDCSDTDPFVVAGSNDEPCTIGTDSSDSVPDDTVPQDSVPEDSVPVTTPVATDPTTTVTTPKEQFPPVPSSAAPNAPAGAAAAAVPAQAAPQTISTTPSLPVTGRGSALPTAFIAIGLLGAGSVALAFARRSSAARSAGES